MSRRAGSDDGRTPTSRRAGSDGAPTAVRAAAVTAAVTAPPGRGTDVALPGVERRPFTAG
ncbi:hypothetical protein GCM10010129_48340 [Streptomyces fumigatiscleroticus]|nr:hypothetical protein GCM10010129_48340 [Streptomyces fumigatiscleroticus]